MRIALPLLALAAASPLAACATYDDGDSFGRPGYAERNYREGEYSERALRDDDQIYRGRDGRYYCRRDDGTTGLIVGAAAGGVLGGLIRPGGSSTLGAILGAGAGALAGRAIDRNDTRCR